MFLTQLAENTPKIGKKIFFQKYLKFINGIKF